jgi:hypothetical protein
VFQPSRDEARAFLVEAWRKQRARELLSPLEAIAADVIAAHPEYHPLLEAPDADLQRAYTPDEGTVNPFLHLHLHLAIAEQLSIDQPPGIRAAHARLAARGADPMSAEHVLIDCLAETMWRAQRDRTPLDAQAYIECIQRKAGA